MNVAIITRTKNRAILLKRCVETVLAQNFQEWQHVIVNDGGDASVVDDLLKKYEKDYRGRLKVIHNSTSLGMEAASNVGIKASDSTYVCILDDDDSWHPEFLKESVHSLVNKQWPDVRGVFCHTQIIYEKIEGEKVIRKNEFPFNTHLKDISLIDLAARNRFTPVSFLFERSALQSVGLFDESLPVCGDWDFNLRFLIQHEIAVLPKPLAFWHQRPNADGVYGNSVHSGWGLHEMYRTRITNRWLRESLKKGTISMGELFVLSLIIEFQNKVEKFKNKIKKIVTLGRR